MKHFLPPLFHNRFSVIELPERTVKVRTPKDLPWKALGWLVEGSKHLIPQSDLMEVRETIRSRDFSKLDEIEERWSPQCMTLLGLSQSEFFAKYQIATFLKKYPFPSDNERCTVKAIQLFKKAEQKCSVFNKEGYKRLYYMSDRDPILSGYLDIMKMFIRKVIGSAPDLNHIFDSGRHGPGSALCTDKGRVTPYYKWSDLPYSVTPLARPLAISCIESDPRWIGAINDWYREKNNIPLYQPINRDLLWDQVLKVVPGNRITFVPKDRSKHRSIAIEPRMNLFLQLGVDHLIRTRLKRFGCDLDSQTKNQILAYEGSVSGKYATLDLSMASDTISMKLIEILFPPMWVNLLYDLRSPSGTLNSTTEEISYEKLSSMGNGFTFAMESLIFLACAFAALVCHNRSHPKKQRFNLHDDISVYGDDIVLPTELAKPVHLLLHYSGFKLNNDKSFMHGPFRESCGVDYYSGTLVRPLYFRKEITDVPSVFSMVNRARFWDFRLGSEGISDKIFETLAQKFSRFIPWRFNSIVGPPSTTEFDTYLHQPLSVAKPVSKYCLYGHFRIIQVSKTGFKGSKFFFRKLMALNRRINSPYEDTVKPLSLNGGNVFTITQRNALCYKLVEARTSFWFDTHYPTV